MNKLYLKYVTRSLSGFHKFLVAVTIILYLIGYFLKKPELYKYGTIIFFICIISWLIHHNQSNLYKYMTINRRVSHLPARQIKLINNIFLAFYVGMTLVLMYLSVLLPYDGVWKFLKAVGRFLKQILSMLFQNISAPSTPDTVESAPPADAYSFDLSSLAEYRGPSTLALLLDYLARIVVIVFLIAGLVYLLWGIYKKLSERNYADKEIEVREFILPEMTHEKAARKNADKAKRLFTDMSPNGRIRKLYIRSVKKRLKKDQMPSAAFTPLEIERFTEMEESEKTKLLHQYYEKARYSEEGCNQEELRRINKKKD